MKLDKWDMEYLASGGANVTWYNQETKKREDYPFAPGRIEYLDSLIIYETDKFMFKDSHNVTAYLCAFKETEDGPMWGFLWGSGLDEAFYDYWPNVFEVKRKAVTEYEYSRVDGRDWES